MENNLIILSDWHSTIFCLLAYFKEPILNYSKDQQKVNIQFKMEDIKKTLDERIMIFDGGMGTMIQNLNLEEEDFRGKICLTNPL